MKHVDTTLKVLVAVACAYEAPMICRSLAGRKDAPTISFFVGKQPWFGAVIVAGLVAHFYWPQISRS